jgi:type II secretory pathway pseudopilin PulG
MGVLIGKILFLVMAGVCCGIAGWNLGAATDEANQEEERADATWTCMTAISVGVLMLLLGSMLDVRTL